MCWFAATVIATRRLLNPRETVLSFHRPFPSSSAFIPCSRGSAWLIAPFDREARSGMIVRSDGRGTRGSRVVLSIVRGIEARAGVQPLCARAEILGDAINELLTLQLHLERLGRVRHDEGIRRARLSQVPRGDFRPFDVERIGRTASGSLAAAAHRCRTERMCSRVQRWCSPSTNGGGHLLLRLRRRHATSYATQPLLWFR